MNPPEHTQPLRTPASKNARRHRRSPQASALSTRRATLTLRTTVHLSGLDVTRILAACAVRGYQVHLGADLDQIAGQRLVRAVVAAYGHQAGFGWDAGLTQEQTGVVVRWAADQARRLWPCLSSPRLSTYVAEFALPLAQLDLDPYSIH